MKQTEIVHVLHHRVNSLEKFANHNKFELAIKVSRNNYGYNSEKKLLTVPFYMFFLVADDLAKGNDLLGTTISKLNP